MELNAVVTVHNKGVLFTTIFHTMHFHIIFLFFRKRMKKERIDKLCNWSDDVLLHVHDNDRNIGSGVWKRQGRQKSNETGAKTFRVLEIYFLSILAVRSVLLDQIWSGKQLVLRL